MNKEKTIRSILVQVDGVSRRDFENISEYLDHNEWGIALDTLCAAIMEDNISITRESYKEIVSVGKEMNMEESTWNGLQHQIK